MRKHQATCQNKDHHKCPLRRILFKKAKFKRAEKKKDEKALLILFININGQNVNKITSTLQTLTFFLLININGWGKRLDYFYPL